MVSDRKQQEAIEKLQKEKELSRVKISKEDVDLIVSNVDTITYLQNLIFC